MSERCSANQIAEFVVLWGLTGTFPERCNYVEDAQKLKSLDLIISTVDVFVDAFCFSFEQIYRKYEMNFPLSHEKFIQFLKPRCLLLTEDNKCFNFMLVCAFVFEIIHSFAHYNKCYHLAEISSKCLAAILKKRFKRIFETDSGWKELTSFCGKIHSLVYPPSENSESDGNQSVGKADRSTEIDDYEKGRGVDYPVINKMDESFSNLTEIFADLSVKKHITHDNNDDLNSKMADLFIEKEGEKLRRFCNLEFVTSVGATHTFQSKDKEKDIYKNTEREGNEKDCITDSLLSDSTNEFTNMELKTKVNNNEQEDIEKLEQMVYFKKNIRFPYEDYLAIKEVTERIEDLCTLGLDATSESQTLQLKGEDSSLKVKSVYKENSHDKMNARANNENVLPIRDKENAEKFWPKNATLPIENYLVMKEATQKIEDLCTLGLSSTSAAKNTLKLKDEGSLPKKAHREKTCNEKNARQDNEVCDAGRKDASSLNSTQNVVNAAFDRNDQNTEKLGQLKDFKKHLTLSFSKATKKTPEKLNLFNLESSSSASHTCQLKGEDFSLKEDALCIEKTNVEKNARVDNVKLSATGMEDSSSSNLTQEVVKVASDRSDDDIEKLGQMNGFKKHLTLSFGNTTKKTPEKLNLFNLEPTSSASASHALQFKGKDYSPNEKKVDGANAREANLKARSTGMKVSHKNYEGTWKLGQMIGLKKCLTLQLVKDLTAKKKPEKSNLLNSEPLSESPSHTLQQKGEDSSPKEESVDKEKNAVEDEKLCAKGMGYSHKNEDGTRKIGKKVRFKKDLTLSFGKDLATKKAPENVKLFHIEPTPSAGTSDILQLKGEYTCINEESVDKEKIIGENKAMDSNKNDYVPDSLLPELAKMSFKKNAINDNAEGAEKPSQNISHRKKLTLSLQKDSVVEKTRKKSMDLHSLVPDSSTDTPHALQFGDTEIHLKDKSERNELFDIHYMSADKIRSRITDGPQHLSEIMDRLKKCEEDIDPNLYHSDEYNIFSDNDEDEVLEASGSASESSINDSIELGLLAKTIVFDKNMKMAQSVRKIFRESNQTDDGLDSLASGGELPDQMSDEVAYVYVNRMVASQDPPCPLCGGKKTPFIDAWTNSFTKKYPNNCLVSDLL